MDEAEDAIESFILETLTPENLKYAFRIMQKYFETENKNCVT